MHELMIERLIKVKSDQRQKLPLSASADREFGRLSQEIEDLTRMRVEQLGGSYFPPLPRP